MIVEGIFIETVITSLVCTWSRTRKSIILDPMTPPPPSTHTHTPNVMGAGNNLISGNRGVPLVSSLQGV